MRVQNAHSTSSHSDYRLLLFVLLSIYIAITVVTLKHTDTIPLSSTLRSPVQTLAFIATRFYCRPFVGNVFVMVVLVYIETYTIQYSILHQQSTLYLNSNIHTFFLDRLSVLQQREALERLLCYIPGTIYTVCYIPIQMAMHASAIAQVNAVYSIKFKRLINQ